MNIIDTIKYFFTKQSEFVPVDNLNNLNNLNINFSDESTKYLIEYLKKITNAKNLYINSTSKINVNLYNSNKLLFVFVVKCICGSVQTIFTNEKYIHLFEPINVWNICICDNVMFNLPFTIENFIYIPLNYLNKCFQNNNFTEFEKTLIHEKIHINQRANSNYWIGLVENKFKNKWKIITKSSNYKLWNLIETEINSINLTNTNKYLFVSNPDINYTNFKYIFLIGDKMFWANYVYWIELNNITIKYFYINVKNNKFEEITNQMNFQDHPFETFAYEISDIICN